MKFPPEKWIPEKPFDQGEFLDGPPVQVELEDGTTVSFEEFYDAEKADQED